MLLSTYQIDYIERPSGADRHADILDRHHVRSLFFAPLARAAQPDVPVGDFVRNPTYSGAKISPNGEYLAMTVERGGQDALAVLRTKDLGIVHVDTLPN
jgi:hypothetical protein